MRKAIVWALGLAVATGVALAGWRLEEASSPSLGPDAAIVTGPVPRLASRLPENPIIRHDMHPRLKAEALRYGYVNINGPSLIRVPPWVEPRLGKYYLYFAHHKGEFIRLAYADRLEGPWTIYGPGVLSLEESRFATESPEEMGLLRSALDLWRAGTLTEFIALARVGLAAQRAQQARKAAGLGGSAETRPHIASPEVLVDDRHRQIRLYFHGLERGRLQMTRVAISSDGIHFRVRGELITPPYLRLICREDAYYGIAMPGLLYRSADGLSGFEVRRKPLLAANTRHLALLARGDTLQIYYTRVGDAPERILCSTVDLGPADWNDWVPSLPFEILRPELPWEGTDLPIEPSLRGESPVPVHQLRDPAIFVEGGETYLLYSAAGEQSIAIARLVEPR